MSFITGAIIFIAGFVIGIFVAALMTAGGDERCKRFLLVSMLRAWKASTPKSRNTRKATMVRTASAISSGCAGAVYNGQEQQT